MISEKPSEAGNANDERGADTADPSKPREHPPLADAVQTQIANKTIVIGINGSCNNDCIFCSSGGSLPSLDVSANKIIERLAPYPLNGVTAILSGGEPTLHKELPKIIRYLNKRGCTTKMMTNARRFSDKKFAKKIADAGLKAITTVINSPCPEVHDFLTQRTGSFSETTRGIKNLSVYGINVVLKIVVNRINYKTLPEIVEKMCKMAPNISEVSLSCMNPTGSAEKNMNLLGIRLQDCSAHIEQSIDTAERFGVFVRVYAIPICALGQKYVKYSAARKDFTYINIGNELTVTSKKYLAAQCKECSRCADCTGVWRKHLLYFGEGELKPEKPGRN